MNRKGKTQKNALNITGRLFWHMAAVLLIGYAAAVLLFYFLAGEQLHLRESRGDISQFPSNSGTVELIAGSTVEQRFITEIQRLEEISVQWGTYYRPNAGTVRLELFDLRDGQLLMSQIFDAAAIAEGGLTALVAETPIEGLYQAPLLLRITSPDSQTGSAVSPLMNTEARLENSALALNGMVTEGVLCFSARGTDYIWTGLHYWEFAVAGFILLFLLFLMSALRAGRGKRSYIFHIISAVQKYRFLIRQLVARDFKTKYKRSVLGVFWSFLNPLLTMLVQYFVFSTIFKADIPNYAVYLLIGIVCFNFFSEACSMALVSIIGNANLITKVYVPKYIYPLTRVISSVVNLSIAMIPLVIVALVTGVHFHKSAVLAFFFLFCLILFSMGLGLFLSSAMVFFRDVQFLWGVMSMIWMYATPIFYPETILPDNFKVILQINPLYYFLKNIRICILDGISPEPVVYVSCMLIAAATLLTGALFFRKTQDRFVLYI